MDQPVRNMQRIIVKNCKCKKKNERVSSWKRNKIFSERNLSTASSSEGDTRIGHQQCEWWCPVLARWCYSRHITWINGLLENHVPWMYHFMLQWHCLGSQVFWCPYALLLCLETLVIQPTNLACLPSWKSTSEMKLEPLMSFANSLRLISKHNGNVLHTTENTYEL